MSPSPVGRGVPSPEFFLNFYLKMVSCGAFWVVFYVIDSYKYKIAKGRTVADGLYTLQTIQLEASIPPITKALYLPTFPFSHPFLVPPFPFFSLP